MVHPTYTIFCCNAYLSCEYMGHSIYKEVLQFRKAPQLGSNLENREEMN